MEGIIVMIELIEVQVKELFKHHGFGTNWNETVFIPRDRNRMVVSINGNAKFDVGHRDYTVEEGDMLMCAVASCGGKYRRVIAYAPVSVWNAANKNAAPKPTTAKPASKQEPPKVLDLLAKPEKKATVEFDFKTHRDCMLRILDGPHGHTGTKQIDAGKYNAFALNKIRLAKATHPRVVVQCETRRGLWETCEHNPLLRLVPTHIEATKVPQAEMAVA